MQNKRVLVTGCAGFIGYHVTKKLIEQGVSVVGIDNINSYYSVSLKQDRLHDISVSAGNELFSFHKMDIGDTHFLEWAKHQQFDGIIHLAAQAGVRYSIENPVAYTHSNLTGFLHVLEVARHCETKSGGRPHLVYASSSSVYGESQEKLNYAHSPADHPVSFYAATKRSNELMAHSYSHLYDIPSTGVRFFTVYGPWGRPDMAPMIFANRLSKNEPIQLFNHGDQERDFTYVSDIVDGLMLVLQNPPTRGETKQSPDQSNAPYQVFNIGASSPVNLMDFVSKLSEQLGASPVLELCAAQPGDVKTTYADISPLQRKLGYAPKVCIDEGLKMFSEWFREYTK